MDAKLTYLFILSFAACLLSSCTSAIPDNVDVGKGVELSFDVSSLTRASVTTSFDKFAVYGDMKFPVNGNTAPTVIFDKTEVEHKNDSWYYDGTQYWFPEHEHSFVAVSPVSVLETGNEPQYSDSRLSVTYSIPTTGNEVNKQELADIIAATHRRIYETASPVTPVKLKFFHIMSRINFMVKCNGAADKITVTKIEFEGINKTGTFTIVPASLLSDSGQTETDDYNLSWTGISNNGTLTAVIDVDVANDNDAHPLFPDNDALFVVPQPENKDIIMKITYKYDINTGTEEQTLTAQEAIGGWKFGKLYLYSLTVDTASKEISMNVSVKEWEHGADNYVDVPRK